MDIAIIETGNGGDLLMKANDLDIVEGNQNMIYLAMFGGNIEQSTSNTNIEAPYGDWWANNLLFKSQQELQLNSSVERIFKTTPLTSAGRVIIENSVKEDLKFLFGFYVLSVTVLIVATDRVDINIRILDNGTEKVKTLRVRANSDGDFFIMDFNDDFFL